MMNDERWHETKIRVRYKDTDRMGVIYYGNYLTYFEVGRAELMRSLGYPYSRVEREGYSLVVVEASARYHSNVGYDSEVAVKTAIAEVKGASVRFEYRVFDDGSTLLVEGHTLHACLDSASQKLTRLPAEVKRTMVEAMTAGRY
jgi:acyl-CoA thioester hydrolase